MATRPAKYNGLELSVEEAAGLLHRLKSLFKLVAEAPDIYPTWEALVTRYRVTGKPVHDARLVATMQVHGITSVLTFDKTMARFTPST